MERMVGTVVRGLRAPIITKGDDIVKIAVDSVLKASLPPCANRGRSPG